MDKEYTEAEAKAWLKGYDACKAFTKKEWVGLDSSDFNDFNPYFEAVEAARWAEKKLKEKNAQAKN